MMRWLKIWPYVFKDFFIALGLLWLVKDVCAALLRYLSVSVSDLHKLWLVYLLVLASFLYAVVKNRPVISYVKKIRGRDACIGIRVGDAFKIKGALIVPVNNMLDMSLNGNVNSAKSIQNKLIIKYFDGDVDVLNKCIADKIDLAKAPYPSGTVLEIDRADRKFYLVVNSHKTANHRATSTIDDFMFALNGVWEYLCDQSGKDEAVIIPLINTQHGRNADLTREVVVKQIIDSFIDQTKVKVVCDRLIITILPSDIEKGSLNLDSLIEYLNFQSENYKDIKFNNKVEGSEITSSTIASISS